MSVRVIFESPADLAEYASVPIAFEVSRKVEAVPSENNTGFTLVERAVEPYIKDYDQVGAPQSWPDEFDLSNWKFLAAFDDQARVGGAVIAYRSDGLEMLDGRNDVACLWDIRVHPAHRGRGIGTMLFDSVVEWSRANGVEYLKIETQDINVPACHFYASRGCRLGKVDSTVYPPEFAETQFLWYLDL